jgi:PAS domain S-box-containing protein
MNKRIFIVDDEVVIGEQVKHFLEQNGCSVELFPFGESCLERLEQGLIPDLVLMDINLGKGRMDGPAVTKIINENYDVPVVLHSAYTDKDTLGSTMETPKYGYIQKVPGNEQFVLATIEMALKLHVTEAKILQAQEFYRTILSSISDTVLLTDEKEGFVYICPNVNVIFGYSREEVAGFPSISDLLGESLITGEQLQREGEIKNRRLVIQAKDGTEHVLLVNIKRVDIGGGTRLYTFRDISELSKKEQALKRSEQMYRELSVHYQNVREEQGKELAREIHDDLGQALTALRMNVIYLEQTLKEAGVNKSEVNSAVRDIKRITHGTIKKVRKISTELRPSVIDTEGIIEALEWQIQEFRKNFEIPVEFSKINQEVKLGSTKSLQIFRIVQESLTNCIRHSGAGRIQVSTVVEDGLLHITVRDNGSGFEAGPQDAHGGYGLIGMQERARQCGGSLRVDSAPGEGTSVRLEIPIREDRGMR